MTDTTESLRASLDLLKKAAQVHLRHLRATRNPDALRLTNAIADVPLIASALARMEAADKTDAVLRKAGYNPEEVGANMRAAAMRGAYARGYGDGAKAENARIKAGLVALAR